tara:strand:- start:797 stop:1111 length:315 start_codon:yes stop_codon:yes gene_type:complete
MNVTLKLTTEFEDIPEEVSYMLKKVGTELGSLRQNVHDVSNNTLEQHEEALQSIHLARLHMAKIDARMADCMSILDGFIHYSENPQELEQPNPDVVQTEENEEG